MSSSSTLDVNVVPLEDRVIEIDPDTGEERTHEPVLGLAVPLQTPRLRPFLHGIGQGRPEEYFAQYNLANVSSTPSEKRLLCFRLASPAMLEQEYRSHRAVERSNLARVGWLLGNSNRCVEEAYGCMAVVKDHLETQATLSLHLDRDVSLTARYTTSILGDMRGRLIYHLRHALAAVVHDNDNSAYDWIPASQFRALLARVDELVEQYLGYFTIPN